ncbi:MAG: hypothetical protein M3P29_04185, partial [Acidobacteriota bacterium]|nr:hypothetical protein [Acidobacteriota bacterium]
MRELRRDREIVDWLRTHAIRLKSVDLMSDLADLQPLAPVIDTDNCIYGLKQNRFVLARLLSEQREDIVIHGGRASRRRR